MNSINGNSSKKLVSINDDNSHTNDADEDDSHLRINKSKRNDMQSLFKICDLDGSGTIDRYELSQLCPNLSSLDIDNVFKDMDKNNDGFINFAEFCEGFGGLLTPDTENNNKKILTLDLPSMSDDKNNKILFHNLALSFKSLSW